MLSSTQTTRFIIGIRQNNYIKNLHPPLIYYTRALIKSIIWVKIFDKKFDSSQICIMCSVLQCKDMTYFIIR